MPNVNFFQSPEYTADQQSIKQKQIIMQALQQGGAAPLAQPEQGRITAHASPWAAASKLFQAYAGHKKEGEIKDEQLSQGDKWQDILTTDIQKFQTLSETDPKAAIMGALASKHPMLQQMAMKKLAEKPTKQDFSNFKTVDGQLVDLTKVGGTGSPVVQTPMYGEPQADARGDLYQTRTGTGKQVKLDNAPRTTINNQMNGQNALRRALGAKTAENLIAAGDAKEGAQRNMLLADDLARIDEEATLSGPLAGVGIFMGALADSAGFPVDKDLLGNSESYQAKISGRVAEVLMQSSVGRGFTDEDRKEFLKQFPQLVTSSEGRKKIIADITTASQRIITRTDTIFQHVKDTDPEAGKFLDMLSSGTPYPPIPGKAGASKPSVSNW